MTLEEFNQWFKQFAAAFPAVQDFVRKSDPTGKATLTLWFEVLSKREVNDCLEVTNRMFQGDMPALPGAERGFPDWSQTPRHVSGLCAQLHPVVPEWKQHTVRTGGKGIIQGDPLMAEALPKAIEILQQQGLAAMRAYTRTLFGGGSPAEARDKGNYEPAFDAFNQS